jgi:ABC-type transport system involved in cytochrome c biogenesis permease subunit
MKKWIPWILVLAMAGWVVSTLVPKPETGFAVSEFGRLPVLLNGRIQPFDSVARNALLQIRNKQTVALKADPGHEELTASAWLLELMMKPETADLRPVLRVDNLELLDLLKLPENEKYFSFSQFKDKGDELDKQAERIDKIESGDRTAFEKQVMKLQNALMLYQRLKVTLRPPDSDDLEAELARFQKSLAAGVAAVRARDAGQKYDEKAFDEFIAEFSGFNTMARFAYPLVVPPAQPEVSRERWESAGTNLMQVARGQLLSPAVGFYAAMVSAYRQDRPADFNEDLRNYNQWLRGTFAPEVKKGRREFFYNDVQAFYKALVIYVLAFVLACVSWFNRSEVLRRSAFYLIVLALAIHTFGIVFRMMLEGRPPVTNLYSSAVFIGWAAALLGLILERLFRDGLGAAIASLVGFVTLVIAHNLALAGDTMEMLRAVLDTNFWLATHVVAVTLGYASTFVAGMLAIFYIIRGVFTRTLDEATGKSLSRMVYGIVCFATLFSFVGTVLGGIWADQSWGRFWGWDPKENGALLIVLWNAAILHARWGGLVRERGLMNMAVFGNIVTSFSWFGVNMLGIGLHSYGFMDAAFKWLMFFVGSQVLIIILGCLPLHLWKSFRNRAAPPPASPKSTGGKAGKTAPAAT